MTIETRDGSTFRRIPGEDDLLPIVLKAVNPPVAGSWYRLHIPDKFRVWEHADRTGPVTELTKLPTDADKTLYVEGTAQGTGVITVDLYFWWVPLIRGADSLTVNVFEWLGPLNVPGYSNHLYTAAGGAPGIGASKWLAPTDGGSLDWSSDGDEFPDQARIMWNGGPVVGRACYQASPDYVWDLNVNVVEVQISTSGVPEPLHSGFHRRRRKRRGRPRGHPQVRLRRSSRHRMAC